ncbi:MAG: putative viral replication protein [Cressdnaviricota sp.]|nr:MAG: putative viral replication protein [Cressdnaviricota sp.]
MRSKYWCFTINNPTSSDDECLSILKEKSSYIVWTPEVGSSGTPHYQGYVEFSTRRTFKSVKADMPRAYLAKRKGSAVQAAAYCKKTNSEQTNEFGEISQPLQGKRTDLDKVKELLDRGTAEKEIADSHFGSWVRYRKSFTAYRLLSVKRDWPCSIIWITGPSGSGKSRIAHENWPDAYYKAPGRWWCGYQGEQVVVLDDFRADDCPYHHLLRWADRYPCLVEIKGATIPLLVHTVVITTCNTPQETYPRLYDRQLERRISQTWDLGDPK